MDFLGVKNVISANAILGSDGVADGFDIKFIEKRKLKNGKVKNIERRKTVWVREFNPDSVKNDGMIHGFGRGVVYCR